MLQLLLIAGLLATSSPDAAAFAACRHASQPPRSCTWRHGTHGVVNGGYPSEIGFRSGHPTTIAIVQPGTAARNEFVPAAVGEAIARYGRRHPGRIPIQAWTVTGDYLICPLAQPRNDRVLRERYRKIACVAGTRRLIASVDRDLL